MNNMVTVMKILKSVLNFGTLSIKQLIFLRYDFIFKISNGIFGKQLHFNID